MEQSTFNFISFPGKIHLIVNDHDLQALAHQLTNIKEFGFDTETRPAFKKGEVYQVALLQLATENEAFIIRLNRLSQFDLIKSLFENPDVVKVGVAIRDDLKQLQKKFKFSPQNFIELQEIAKSRGLENFGLKGLTEEVLNFTITKGPKTTNWEAVELTDRQLLYAATDAWIGLKLYKKLIQQSD